MSSIEYITRAIIEKDGRVLLCHGKGKENWFFPGGHIEHGESARMALIRELKEELGTVGHVIKFLGASENKFEIDGQVTQEINIIFEVTLGEGSSYESKEDHIEFGWFTYEELRDKKVFPLALRDAVLSQASISGEKAPFWVSEGF